MPDAAHWNGKFLGVGNGALTGAIWHTSMVRPLQGGYAVANSDLGHPISTANWALGHPEKVIDYAYRGDHVTAQASKAIVDAFYGHRPAPLVLPRLLERRPPGADGSAALPGRLRRDHRRSAVEPVDAPERRVHLAGDCAREPESGEAIDDHQRRHRAVRRPRRRPAGGRLSERAAALPLRSEVAPLRGRRRADVSDGDRGRRRRNRSTPGRAIRRPACACFRVSSAAASSAGSASARSSTTCGRT